MSYARGSTATLQGEYRDGSGSLVDPVTPLVSILDPAAVTVVTNAVPTRDSLGLYHYDYAISSSAELGTWIARWTGILGGTLQTGDDEFEVTSAGSQEFYFTIAEARALPNLGDAGRFTDLELTEARKWFETTFEDYVGMAFVSRTATQRLVGGHSELMLRRWPVRSITAVRSYTTASVYTSFTADELADIQRLDTGELRRYALGYWPDDVEVEYVHGQEAPPADVKREALVAVQEKLMEDNSGRPVDRTYGVATDGVFVRSILPGKDKPFGIASVDEVANRYRSKYYVPAIG